MSQLVAYIVSHQNFNVIPHSCFVTKTLRHWTLQQLTGKIILYTGTLMPEFFLQKLSKNKDGYWLQFKLVSKKNWQKKKKKKIEIWNVLTPVSICTVQTFVLLKYFCNFIVFLPLSRSLGLQFCVQHLVLAYKPSQ